MSFKDLNLSPKVLAAVEAAGYTEATPIQMQAIPHAVDGKDILGIAQTGTGKTASFVLPMLTRLERGRARARMPRSLILAPTRELAAQVAQAFDSLGSQHKLTVALLIGGVSFDDQDRKLDRGADVVIATPGRLLDHFQRGKLLLTAVEILVIDEADRMLDMGFIPDIEKICKLLPVTRQTLFFSATMPPEIQGLVQRFLKTPERIEVAPPSTTATTITQKFKVCPRDPKMKRQVLREVMQAQNDIQNAIIFCNRKRDVAILLKSLLKHGFNAGALHGDMDQHNRTATLDSFKKGEITFLAASDVAARGLDIPEVSHVFNYDMPMQAEDYVHRIGRTGRAGRKGYAATLVTDDDIKVVKAIEKMSSSPLDWMEGQGLDYLPQLSQTGTSGGRSGRRHGRSDSPPRGDYKDKSSAKPFREPRSDRNRHERSGTARVDSASTGSEMMNAEKQGYEKTQFRENHRDQRKENAPNRPASGAISQDHTIKKGPYNDRRERHHPRDREPAVIGFADHTPAFLLRPVRPANS